MKNIRKFVESKLLDLKTVKQESMYSDYFILVKDAIDDGIEIEDDVETYKKVFGSLPSDLGVFDGSDIDPDEEALYDKMNTLFSKLTKKVGGSNQGYVIKAGTVNGANVLGIADFGAVSFLVRKSDLSKVGLS